MATYTNNGGVLECSGTDITSAGIYAALISEGIGSGHVEDTGGAIAVYVFNAPLRIMAGGIWDFSNEFVKINSSLFEIYGDVFSGSESSNISSDGGGFVFIGPSNDTFRLRDNSSFKIFGGSLYSNRRVRADNNVDFWAIDCDIQLLDSVSTGENGTSYGSNQDIRYDRSRIHDASAVGVKLYGLAAASFSLPGTKVQNCVYAFQLGNSSNVAPVLFDVAIDSCTFHTVPNIGSDSYIGFVNPDFLIYRPSTIGLDSSDICDEMFRYELNVLDSSNSPIAGAAVVIRDQAGTVQSSDFTDVSGNVSDLPVAGGKTVLYRATNAGSTRTIRAETTRSICKYGYLIRQDTFTVNSDFVDNANLVVDQQITLSEAAAAALTEVSSPSEAIAAINKYIQDNYNEESELPVFIDNGALNCRDNTVVFDAAAAQVVAYSGSTLTLKASLFEGLVITTSTVSTANGAVQTGGIISADGDSFLSFQAVDSWISYASESDQDANTNALASGTSSDIYQFTYSGGATYYLRLIVSGQKIFDAVTPAAPGETPIDLGNAAQLTVINASIQESSQLAEYAGRVTVDLISGTNSTDYPYGTSKTPTSTIANAIAIADDIGVKVIEVRGSSTTLPQELNGYELIAGVTDSVGAKLLPQISLTTLNGADNCEFKGFEVTGATDVTSLVFGNLYESCLLNGVDGLTGVSRNCKLAGTIQVEHSVDVQGSYGTVDFSVSGTNARLTVPDFSGSMTLSSMASATAVAIIGVVSGIVTIDATCSAGTIVVANADQVVDNSTGASVTILQDSGGGSGLTAQQVWEYDISSISTDGLAGKELLDASGAGSGADVNIVSVNGVAVTNINDFKADVSGLPTALEIDTQLSVTHGAGSWSGDDAATIYTYFTDGVRADAFKATGFSTFDPLTTSVTVSAIENNVITASAIANNAFTNSAFTTGYYNTINSELDTALADYDAPTKAELDAGLAALQAHGDLTWQTATGFSTFNPATDTVARVALVDVCTENTDQRGTDGANTIAPDNAAIAAISARTELIVKYHDNDTVFLAADGVTQTTQSLAYSTVTFDDDGITPLKTVSFRDASDVAAALPNATGYKKL